MSTTATPPSPKRKLPEWIKKYDGDSSTCDTKKVKTTQIVEEEVEEEVEVFENKSEKGVQLTLAKARLAMSLLAEEDENEKDWEQDKIAMDGNDSFVALFDLEQCSLMACMEVEDVLEVITKIKGSDYTSSYPYMYDREALMFDIDECFVKYCNMHGIRVQY